jgi:PIN domain nuclease of toxin-antitoxin system
MRLLLDTHAFLWWSEDSKRLSSRVRSLIIDPANDVYLSAASASEIAIKARLGRLVMPDDLLRWLKDQLDQDEIEVLPVALAHAAKLRALPLGHRDPFDLLLIAQALVDELSVATVDPVFRAHGVEVVW